MTTTKYPNFLKKSNIVHESSECIEKKISALLCSMTQDEKLSLLHGASNPDRAIANAGFLPGVPRLGIPEIRMFDGSSGVTYTEETTGLPVELCLAATFDPEMAHLYGKVCGSENVAVSGNMQLGCQLDLVRALPTASGNMLGEDMTLGAKLGTSLVQGIQGENCIAVAKHLCSAGGGAADTNQYSAIDEQTMHERVLPVIEAALTHGKAGAVMAAYDRINGKYVTQSDDILNGILHKQWAWDGVVMSDWGANHSLTVHKGTDLEMPTGAYNSDERVLRAIQKGRISWDDVDKAVSHVLFALGTAGYLSLVTLDDDGAVVQEPGRTERIKLPVTLSKELLDRNAEYAYQIAKRGIVLLKNDDHTLPLCKNDYTGDSITAVFGLTGMRCQAGDGAERAYGVLERMISPCEAIKNASGGNIRSAVAMDMVGSPIPGEYLYQDSCCTMPGLVRTYGIKEDDAAIDPMLKRVLEGNEQNAGGAGKEFIGVADADPEEDEPIPFAPMWIKPAVGDMEGHTTGEVYGVDPVINFTTGTKNYRNGPNGTALSKGEIYTWNGFLKVPEDGVFTLSLHAIGGAAAFYISIDGQKHIVGQTSLREGAHWPWSSIVCTDEGMDINSSCFHLHSGDILPITITGMAELEEKDLQLQIAWITPSQRNVQYQEALELAERAAKAVVFVSPHELQEIDDNPFARFSAAHQMDKSISKHYQQLIHDISHRIHANGGKLIVVLNIGLGLSGGVFVPGPWLDECDALLDMWTAGQEGSRAIADILLGTCNPSGKMPITIPWKNEDGPLSDTEAHIQERLLGKEDGTGNIVRHHDEGILFGYRWYDHNKIAPCFPFGYGLSYTSFTLSDMQVISVDGEYDVVFSVTNTGDRAGDCTPQLYLGAGHAPEHIQMAEKQLVDSAVLRNITPGEKRVAKLHISDRALSKWDIHGTASAKSGKWKRIKGTRCLYLGQSSIDIELQQEIHVI